MPRHKKDAYTKQLEGTFRKDRDGTSDQGTMTNYLSAVPPAPDTLKTQYARDAWAVLIPPLCAMKRLCDEDVVTVQVAFEALDDSAHFKKQMEAMEPDDSRIPAYASLVKNYRQQFLDTMRRYGTTLYDRMAMRAVLAGTVKKVKGVAEKMTE